MANKHILILSGGTGGHIFPALSVANELKKRGVQISWLGSKTGMEQTIVPKYKYKLYSVNSVGLRGKKITKLLQAPFLLLLALIQTIIIFIKIKPTMVLGMGGFSSGIGGIVAKIFNIPLIIHEQNAIAGTTNKILARVANTTYQAFAGSFDKKIAAITIGNPINFNKQNKTPISTPLKLLVIGGSLGARAINNIIPKLQTHLTIVHQTGSADYQKTLNIYKAQNNKNTQVVEFISDMASAYAQADIVICRCGAMTISELMLSGSASILIPFTFAVDDHQTLNAKILSNVNAAILLPEAQLSITKLDNILSQLTADKIISMGQKSQSLAQKDAHIIIANRLLK